jgi:hypothetical protein
MGIKNKHLEIKDKRLVNRMDMVQQQKYLEKIGKVVPDASDKFEELEVTHEPIGLLNKIKSRKIDGEKVSDSAEQTVEDDT